MDDQGEDLRPRHPRRGKSNMLYVGYPKREREVFFNFLCAWTFPGSQPIICLTVKLTKSSFKMCPQNASNAISWNKILKIFWGSMLPDPPLVCLCH